MTNQPLARPRPAHSADLEAVVDLERSCLGDDAWSENLIASVLAGTSPHVESLVVSATPAVVDADGDSLSRGLHPHQHRLVGYAVLAITADIAELQRIGVVKAERRSGHASALMKACLDRASRAGADRLLVEVRADNATALSFYAHHGFVEIDRRPKYYSDEAEAVVLRRALGRGCGGGR